MLVSYCQTDTEKDDRKDIEEDNGKENGSFVCDLALFHVVRDAFVLVNQIVIVSLTVIFGRKNNAVFAWFFLNKSLRPYAVANYIDCIILEAMAT